MSGEWPDELRQMVDALMHGGACPSVYGITDGGHRIHTGRAWADYDEQGRWWFDGSVRNAAVVLAELLQRSDTVDARYALQERITAAVPGALVATTTDGIEVSVGSKSVRWKREQRGWSMDDDLYTTDERVIEHAQRMAVEQAASLLERLRTAIPSLTWRQEGDECIGCDARGDWRAAVTYEIDLGDNQAYIVTTKAKTCVDAQIMQGFDAVVQHIGRYLHGDGESAAPQPSPRAQALLDALRAQGYEPRCRRYLDREWIECDSEVAYLTDTEQLWWYLGAQAGTEYVAEQMHLRIARRRERTLDTTAAMQAADSDLSEEAEARLWAEIDRAFGPARFRALMDKAIKNTQAKGPTTMTQTKTQALIQTATADASEAAWRTAGSQFVKLAREPLVGLLTRHLAPNDDAFRARLAAFLETELGTALLASMLSATLSALPQTTGEVPQKLARELRVKAMADTGDVMADVLAGPLRRVMADYLHGVSVTSSPALGDGAETVGDDLLRAAARDPVSR